MTEFSYRRLRASIYLPRTRARAHSILSASLGFPPISTLSSRRARKYTRARTRKRDGDTRHVTGVPPQPLQPLPSFTLLLSTTSLSFLLSPSTSLRRRRRRRRRRGFLLLFLLSFVRVRWSGDYISVSGSLP